MNTEKGMYFKDNYGEIGKILDFYEKIYWVKLDNTTKFIHSLEINSPSHNIIDVIEEGDLMLCQGKWREVRRKCIDEYDKKPRVSVGDYYLGEDNLAHFCQGLVTRDKLNEIAYKGW